MCNINYNNTKQDLCAPFFKMMCIYLIYSHFQLSNRVNNAYLFKIGKIPS